MSSDVGNTSAKTVLVEPSLTVDLKEVAGKRAPSPITTNFRQRRSPRFKSHVHSDVTSQQNCGISRPLHTDKEKNSTGISKITEKSPSLTDSCCVKIVIDSQDTEDECLSSELHNEFPEESSLEDCIQDGCMNESPYGSQTNKTDILSVVIEKLTELVENSEKEQKEKAANLDSSGASTPNRVVGRERSRSPARSQSKLYKCPNCPCLFAVTEKQLRTKNSPVCQCCEKARNAEKVVQRESGEHKFVSCDVCHYKVLNYPCLLQHLATHPKAEIYKCVLCDYVTTAQASIISHQGTHVQVTPCKYQCNSCGYSTTELGDLQPHLLMHNKQGELLLKCSECGFSCKCEDTLRSHMWKHVPSKENQDSQVISDTSKRCHEEDRPHFYKCLLCGYICEKLCTLKAHVWRHAGERECAYPIVDEDDNLKKSLDQDNLSNTEENMEVENVSRIAVGCCGETSSGCCMKRDDGEAQCECPAINIPSTSVAALQKCAINAGFKRSRSPHHISKKDKMQGNSCILSPRVLGQLIRGVKEPLVNDAIGATHCYENCKESKKTSDQDQVVPIDIPLEVQTVEGEVEVTTTEASSSKSLLKASVNSLSANVSQTIQKNSVKESGVGDSRITQTSVNIDVESEMPTSPSCTNGELEENSITKTTSYKLGMREVKSANSSVLLVNKSQNISSSEKADLISENQRSLSFDDTSQPSNAMEALSDVEAGECCDPFESAANVTRKRKLDNPDATEVYKSHKQACLAVTSTLALSNELEALNQSGVTITENNKIINDCFDSCSLITGGNLPSSTECGNLSTTSSKQVKEVAEKATTHPDLSGIQDHIIHKLNSIQGKKLKTSNSAFSDMATKESSELEQISNSDLKQQGISESLLTVIEKLRGETECGGGNTYYCPVCGHKADTRQNLKDHIQLCHCKSQLKCSKCPAVFYIKSKLDAHQVQHEVHNKSNAQKEVQLKASSVCEHCNRVFIGMNAMSTHKRSCLPNCNSLKEMVDDNVEENYQVQFDKWECPKCNATFMNKTTWLSHLELHFTQDRSVVGDVQESDSKKCPTCNREFVGTFALSIHKRSCIKKRWYECLECDYSAPTPAELTHHVAIHKKPYKCELCQYTSASVSGIRNHMKFHSTEKPYKCELCDFRGAYPQSLRSHMKAHQTFVPNQVDTVEQFKCKICGYICNHLPSLKSHMWKHASDPEYNYDIVNDAINAVMDGLTTTSQAYSLKTVEVNKDSNSKQPVITALPPSNTSKTFGGMDASSTPQLIMMNTASTKSKMVVVSKNALSQEGVKQNKSMGIEYGMMVLKCSECEFQCVSKNEMYLHVMEHNKASSL